MCPPSSVLRQPVFRVPRQEYLDAIHHLYEEWLIHGGPFPVPAPVLVSPSTGQGTFLEGGVAWGAPATPQSGEGPSPAEPEDMEAGSREGGRVSFSLSVPVLG